MTDSKVPALQRVNDILGFIAERGSCLAGDVIDALPIPKSSVYLLLAELEKIKMITQDSDGRYRLWLRLIELGECASASMDIREVARRHLTRLMEKTGLLCHLGIMDGEAAYYVLKIESSSSILVRSREGRKLSLYRSGIGKCLLAFQPKEKRDALIDGFVFEQATPTTIMGAGALRKELQLIRSRGWGFDNEEDIPNIRCVAAPVFGARGNIVASISVVGASVQITDDIIPSLAAETTGCARDISKGLGWNGNIPIPA